MRSGTFSARGVAGVIALLIGGVWIAQGLDLLKGSPMTGVGFWAGAGTVLVIAGAALIVVLAAIGYWRQRSRDPGVTTEVALFITYVIGIVAMDRPALAAGAAVVVAALLASRGSLHRFPVDVLSQSELRDGLLFCGAALIVFPLLPQQGPEWLRAVNPRRL